MPLEDTIVVKSSVLSNHVFLLLRSYNCWRFCEESCQQICNRRHPETNERIFWTENKWQLSNSGHTIEASQQFARAYLQPSFPVSGGATVSLELEVQPPLGWDCIIGVYNYQSMYDMQSQQSRYGMDFYSDGDVMGALGVCRSDGERSSWKAGRITPFPHTCTAAYISPSHIQRMEMTLACKHTCMAQRTFNQAQTSYLHEQHLTQPGTLP